MKINLKKFVKERDAALRSLDRKKIEAYMKKYGVSFNPSSEKVFWGAIHKARCECTSFTDEEKRVSGQWLLDNGFKVMGII